MLPRNLRCILLSCLAAFATAIALAWLPWWVARADTVVTDCTYAGLEAALAAGGKISFSCNGTGDPAIITVAVATGTWRPITQATSIDGGGVITLTAQDNAHGLFQVEPDVGLTLTNLVIANGHGTTGGALYNQGTLFVSHTVFVSNRAGTQGGALYNTGSAVLIESLFRANAAMTWGGAVSNQGALVAINTDFSQNSNDIGPVGSAIANQSAQLTILGGTFSGNVGGSAVSQVGGLGTGLISGTLFLSNQGINSGYGGPYGGAIYAASEIYVLNSSFISNHASYGGAIAAYANVNVENSLFLRNDAYLLGGAIDGNATITNSTFSRNWAGSGGALSVSSNITLVNSTLEGNNATISGTNIYGSALLHNVIIGGAISSTSCSQPQVSLGHNLDQGNSCSLSAAGDMTNTNPLLLPLNDYGGPTWTMGLQPNSPAIDAGDSSGCPATDQRGVVRPQFVRCDIGAFEFNLTPQHWLPIIRR